MGLVRYVWTMLDQTANQSWQFLFSWDCHREWLGYPNQLIHVIGPSFAAMFLKVWKLPISFKYCSTPNDHCFWAVCTTNCTGSTKTNEKILRTFMCQQLFSIPTMVFAFCTRRNSVSCGSAKSWKLVDAPWSTWGSKSDRHQKDLRRAREQSSKRYLGGTDCIWISQVVA